MAKMKSTWIPDDIHRWIRDDLAQRKSKETIQKRIETLIRMGIAVEVATKGSRVR